MSADDWIKACMTCANEVDTPSVHHADSCHPSRAENVSRLVAKELAVTTPHVLFSTGESGLPGGGVPLHCASLYREYYLPRLRYGGSRRGLAGKDIQNSIFHSRSKPAQGVTDAPHIIYPADFTMYVYEFTGGRHSCRSWCPPKSAVRRCEVAF